MHSTDYGASNWATVLTFWWYGGFIHLLRQMLLLLENETGGNTQRMPPQQLHTALRSGGGVHDYEVQGTCR